MNDALRRMRRPFDSRNRDTVGWLTPESLAISLDERVSAINRRNRSCTGNSLFGASIPCIISIH
ncbi:hypothetical protein PSAB6_10349 [Paraburkholderia sabiae]|nr:hypothetical protein PSAB6_10349 [Paraburkholderia sabiae]